MKILTFLPLPFHWRISHKTTIADHIKYIFSESTVIKVSKTWGFNSVIAMVATPTYLKYIMANKIWKNKLNFKFTLNNTHKANNNHKVHQLATKQKNIWKMFVSYSKLNFTKKLAKPQFLGFLTFIK